MCWSLGCGFCRARCVVLSVSVSVCCIWFFTLLLRCISEIHFNFKLFIILKGWILFLLVAPRVRVRGLGLLLASALHDSVIIRKMYSVLPFDVPVFLLNRDVGLFRFVLKRFGLDRVLVVFDL